MKESSYVMANPEDINDEKEKEMDVSTMQLKLEELERRLAAVEDKNPSSEPRKLSEEEENSVAFLLGGE